MRSLEPDFDIFTSPFAVDVRSASADVQLELIDLQCDSFIKERFRMANDIIQFYSFIPRDGFPRLHAKAAAIMCMFGSTYLCEQLFSALKLCKSRHRSQMTNSHLRAVLRLHTTSSICPDIPSLTANHGK